MFFIVFKSMMSAVSGFFMLDVPGLNFSFAVLFFGFFIVPVLFWFLKFFLNGR